MHGSGQPGRDMWGRYGGAMGCRKGRRHVRLKQNRVGAFPAPGRAALRELESGYAEAPDISARVVVLPADELWRHPAWSTDEAAALADPLF